MDISEFEDLLDRLGGDLKRWPAEKQQSAAKLLAQSAEARDLVDEAASLSRLLSRPPVRAPAGLADKIVVQAIQHQEAAKEPARAWFPPRWREGRTIFLSICFFGGILAGVLASKPLRELPYVDVHDYVAYILNFSYPVD